MTVKNSIRWTIPVLISTLIISGCSMLGSKKIEVSSKPIEIDIIQPTMPRNIDLKDPTWHVVSSAKIANPCVKDEEGKRPRQKIDGKWVCDLGKENEWPEVGAWVWNNLDSISGISFLPFSDHTHPRVPPRSRARDGRNGPARLRQNGLPISNTGVGPVGRSPEFVQLLVPLLHSVWTKGPPPP